MATAWLLAAREMPWPSPSATGNRVTMPGVGAGLRYMLATVTSMPATIAEITAGIARRHNGLGGVTPTTEEGTLHGCAESDCSSARRSPTACQRRFGFLS